MTRDAEIARGKRSNEEAEASAISRLSTRLGGDDGSERKRMKSVLESLGDVKYGSITEECELLLSRSREMRKVVSVLKRSLFKTPSSLASPSSTLPSVSAVSTGEQEMKIASFMYNVSDEEDREEPPKDINRSGLETKGKIDDSVIYIDSDEEAREPRNLSYYSNSSELEASACVQVPSGQVEILMHGWSSDRDKLDTGDACKENIRLVNNDDQVVLVNVATDTSPTDSVESHLLDKVDCHDIGNVKLAYDNTGRKNMQSIYKDEEKVECHDLGNAKLVCDNAGRKNMLSISKDEEILHKNPDVDKPFSKHVNDNCGENNNNEGIEESIDSQVIASQEFQAHDGPNYDEKWQYQSLSIQSDPDSDLEPSEDQGLEGLWKEMSLAMEYTKNVTLDRSTTMQRDEECEHVYVLKDDLGLVCRICGIIQKSIEQIFDYQWRKGYRTIRTYSCDSRTSKSDTSALLSEPKVPGKDLLDAQIAIHPRHEKQMKAHQLAGFNFLVRNLVSDEPGGCILAHAPGSGKTFMVISFIQSFLGKYPFARPLIVLPKGILCTWQREFKKWQVENIPLYDFYSAKANKRTQQLVVLKNWEENKSILFLGYKQLANIMSNAVTNDIAAACEKILLKVPSLLIIDEGHTPRNDDTDVLLSLAKIQTPRKVVLSGTLYQNHVKEVFNILNLVRPKFLKMESSRAVVQRIGSHVKISGARRHCRAGVNSYFFELVEETLQNDDFNRKVTVIKDLRDMTREVLHYHKGDFLDELPGILDFTVLLKLTPRQEIIDKKLGKLDKFERASMCSAVYVHPQLNKISENGRVEKGCNIKEGEIDNIIDKLKVRDGVKMNFLLNILSLSESSGEKVLVFSQYLLPLNFMEKFLSREKGWRSGKELFIISGDSSSEQRERSMDQFNNSPNAKVLFGSIKACGEGISLVGASRVVILDVHLNPSVTRQAIGRAFRPGQTKKVYVYRLVAADSPEEEDHLTSFRKELTSKMWFEWSEYFGHQDFALGAVDVQDCEDTFLGSPHLVDDIKSLYRRYL